MDSIPIAGGSLWGVNTGVIKMAGAWAAIGIAAVAIATINTGVSLAAPVSTLPSGDAAYAAIAVPTAPTSDYLIVPGDTLTVRVFQEPELSTDEVAVDGGGNIQMPLVGEIAAARRSPTAVSAEITTRLRERYLVNPQVTVSVKKPAMRTVSVEGQVVKPGVYEIDRTATLLSAVAKAESPTRVARLTDVVVFRTIDGNRAAARFNLADIRAARAPDPAILGGDVVVVGFSHGKGAFRDFLQAAPLFNLFYLLR
jgi:polysaccharide export outer membrane protein